MKKVLKGIVDHIKSTAGHAWAATFQVRANARLKLAEGNGQFVVDHSMVFVIILVLGGIALAAMTGVLNVDLLPALKGKLLGTLN